MIAACGTVFTKLKITLINVYFTVSSGESYKTREHTITITYLNPRDDKPHKIYFLWNMRGSPNLFVPRLIGKPAFITKPTSGICSMGIRIVDKVFVCWLRA